MYSSFRASRSSRAVCASPQCASTYYLSPSYLWSWSWIHIHGTCKSQNSWSHEKVNYLVDPAEQSKWKHLTIPIFPLKCLKYHFIAAKRFYLGIANQIKTNMKTFFQGKWTWTWTGITVGKVISRGDIPVTLDCPLMIGIQLASVVDEQVPQQTRFLPLKSTTVAPQESSTSTCTPNSTATSTAIFTCWLLARVF